MIYGELTSTTARFKEILVTPTQNINVNKLSKILTI